MTYEFIANVWRYPGEAAWFFVSMPKNYAQEIQLMTSSKYKGFGSVKVDVQILHISWQTSIFPDNKTNTYLLPIKKQIRAELGLHDDSEIVVKVTILDVD